MKRQNKYHFFFGGFRNSLYLCNVVWLRLYDFAECLKKRYFTNYNIKVMKKLLLMKTMLLLCALIVGSSSVWAGTITFSDLGLENGVQYSDPFDGGDFTVTFAGGANDGKYYTTGAGIRVYGDGTMTIAAKSGNLTQIVITYDGSNKPTTNDVVNVGTYNNSTGTWTGEAASVVFTRPSGSGHWRVKTITATVSGGSTPTCATPTFLPDGGVYTSPQNVTISTETDGATIYYTKDGTTPTASSTEYTGAINVNATTTIKAIAVKDGNYDSSVATAEYIILGHTGTQADPYTVADARAAIDANFGVTDVYVTGIVSEGGSNLSSGAMNYWISDDGEEINELEAFKGKNLDNTNFTAVTNVKVGDVVVIYGSLKKYGSTYEFTEGNYLVSHKIKPATPTFSPAASTYTSAQTVTISCATAGAAIYYTTDGTTPTSASTLYTAPINVGATTTIKAIAINDGLSSDVATAEFVIDLTPFVLVDENSIEATTAEKEGTITVTYGNLTDVIADVEFYEADGTTPATYDHSWIVADINSSNNMDYVIAENTLNVVRKAYVKVYAIGNEGEARSELITITQAAADYASLPFTFNGGRSAISSTTGLTQNGLGTDYSADPKLKFDSASDNLILNFKETPGILSFDIKGNSFSGGTFKVQTSVDGETYTDLDTFTELDNKDAETKKYNNIAANIRYIKWVYTSKDKGNVGLGNISLTNVIPVTVSAAGLATFANDYALDFTNVENLEAYIAKENGTTIELEKVDKVPANTGVLLRAKNSATDFNVPVTTAAADDVAGNIFVRGTGAAVESGTGPYNYVLGKHDGVVGFYKAGGMVVATNKAYLQTTIAAARIDVNFDETTALTLVNSEKRTVNSAVFNLAGQRVANPTKGLYIVNGKKVVVK